MTEGASKLEKLTNVATSGLIYLKLVHVSWDRKLSNQQNYVSHIVTNKTKCIMQIISYYVLIFCTFDLLSNVPFVNAHWVLLNIDSKLKTALWGFLEWIFCSFFLEYCPSLIFLFVLFLSLNPTETFTKNDTMVRAKHCLGNRPKFFVLLKFLHRDPAWSAHFIKITSRDCVILFSAKIV